MPDLLAVVIQQARAIARNWSSGARGPTLWRPTALTAADRAALDARSRRGGGLGLADDDALVNVQLLQRSQGVGPNVRLFLVHEREDVFL